jgi:hypothetical protein
VSQPIDDPGMLQASVPATARRVPRRAVRIGGARKARRRSARVVVRKVGPWSVFKLSLFFYFCIMLVVVGALTILYLVLGAIGALDSLTRLIRDLGLGTKFEIHGGWLLQRAFLLGIVMVVLWSLINVFVTFLYNLISDVIGGVEVTLAEKR